MARQRLVPRFLRASLQRRLILLVVLRVSSWLAGRESVRRILDERRAMARVFAQYLEYVLRQWGRAGRRTSRGGTLQWIVPLVASPLAQRQVGSPRPLVGGGLHSTTGGIRFFG